MVPGLRNGKKAAVLEALRTGNTRRAACEAVGIHHDTFYEWVRTDPTLSDAVMRAEADAEQFFVSKIKEAAPEDWRAAESWLKRRRRGEWGDSLDLGKLSPEQIAGLLLREAALAGGAEEGPYPADPASEAETGARGTT